MILLFILGLVFISDPAWVISIFSYGGVIAIYVIGSLIPFTAAAVMSNKYNKQSDVSYSPITKWNCYMMCVLAFINIFLLIAGFVK